jgi:class 3 adenylate cyclase
MGSGSEMRVSGRPSLKSRWTYVPGGAGAGRRNVVSPTHVALPGKPRASGNGGWRGTQRGARSLRGGCSIPIRTYPEWILGIDGWATRTGRGCDAPAACSESGIGDGVHQHQHRLCIIFPTAGDRGNSEPGCRCPTGAALRRTNRRAVSSGNRWLDRKGPRPPRFRRGWHTGDVPWGRKPWPRA